MECNVRSKALWHRGGDVRGFALFVPLFARARTIRESSIVPNCLDSGSHETTRGRGLTPSANMIGPPARNGTGVARRRDARADRVAPRVVA